MHYIHVIAWGAEKLKLFVYLWYEMGRDKKTHVSYLWRINLILSYLFLRSSIGFRFCISHIWLVCGAPCCKMKEIPSRSAACWHNQHLCFLALTCITLLTCIDYLWRIRWYLLLLKHYCWIQFWYRPYFVDSWHSTPGVRKQQLLQNRRQKKILQGLLTVGKINTCVFFLDPFQ